MSERQANPRYKFNLEGVGQPEIDLGAARLKEFMSLIGYSISSDAAREGIAIILGYGKWPDLVSSLGTIPPLMMTPETGNQNKHAAKAVPAWGDEFYGANAEPEYTPASEISQTRDVSQDDGSNQIDAAVSGALDTMSAARIPKIEVQEEIVRGGPWSTPARITRAVPQMTMTDRIREHFRFDKGAEECSALVLDFAASPRGKAIKDHWPGKRIELTRAAIGCYFDVCEMDNSRPSMHALLAGFKLTGPGSFSENLSRMIDQDPERKSVASSLIFLSSLPGLRITYLLDGTLSEADPSARSYNLIALTIVNQISAIMKDFTQMAERP